jgi:hypothetical protein
MAGKPLANTNLEPKMNSRVVAVLIGIFVFGLTGCRRPPG